MFVFISILVYTTPLHEKRRWQALTAQIFAFNAKFYAFSVQELTCKSRHNISLHGNKSCATATTAVIVLFTTPHTSNKCLQELLQE